PGSPERSSYLRKSNESAEHRRHWSPTRLLSAPIELGGCHRGPARLKSEPIGFGASSLQSLRDRLLSQRSHNGISSIVGQSPVVGQVHLPGIAAGHRGVIVQVDGAAPRTIFADETVEFRDAFLPLAA